MTTALPLEALLGLRSHFGEGGAKWGHFQRLGLSVKRLVFVSLLISIIYLLFTSSAFAQTVQETIVGEPEYETVTNAPFSPNLSEDVPRDQRAYIQSVMIEVMAGLICQLSGVDPIRQDRRCLGADPATGKIGFVEGGGGAIGLMGGLIATTFTPPASSVQYGKYLASNFGLSEKAYAQTTSPCVGNSQGVGFCGITPLISAWVAMRNITYLLLVLIFAIIGVAIMLRVRIDPRTVMTIQNQIPKIIVAIVMITFSFAIAGLLIDIMYVSIYLVGQVILDIKPGAITNFGEVATSGTTFDAINRLFDDGFAGLAVAGANTVRGLIENVLSADLDITWDLVAILRNPVGFVGGLIIQVFAILVILIALIYIAVRLFIVLLVAYISVLLDVVFAPFWLLIGLVPGSSMGVGAWFRDIISNLAAFPTALSMFLLAKVFFEIISDPSIGVSGALFTPPLVGGTGGGDNSASIFAGLVALGFLFMTPNVIQITKAALKAPKINYGPVLQPAAVGGRTIVGTGKGAAQTITQGREFRVSEYNKSSGKVEYGRYGQGKAFFRKIIGG